jgi:hypothetical protein
MAADALDTLAYSCAGTVALDAASASGDFATALDGMDGAVGAAACAWASVQASRALASVPDVDERADVQWAIRRSAEIQADVLAIETRIADLRRGECATSRALRELLELCETVNQARERVRAQAGELRRLVQSSSRSMSGCGGATGQRSAELQRALLRELLRLMCQHGRVLRGLRLDARRLIRGLRADAAHRQVLEQSAQTLRELGDSYARIHDQASEEQHDARTRLGYAVGTGLGRTAGAAGATMVACTATAASMTGCLMSGLGATARAAEVGLTARDLSEVRRKERRACALLESSDSDVLRRLGRAEREGRRRVGQDLRGRLVESGMALGGSGAATVGAAVLMAHPITGVLLVAGGSLTLAFLGVTRLAQCMSTACMGGSNDDDGHVDSETCGPSVYEVGKAAEQAQVLEPLAEYADLEPAVLRDSLRCGHGATLLQRRVPALRTSKPQQQEDE